MKNIIARRELESKIYHGREIVDEYAWLRDAAWPNLSRDNIGADILRYLDAENQHYDEVSALWKDEKDAIYGEIESWIPDEDRTAPQRKGSYMYYSRIAKGESYYSHWRFKCAKESAEFHDERDVARCAARGAESEAELLLNENSEAKGEYFRLISLKVSECEDMLAYVYDDVGDERGKVIVKRISTGEIIDDVVRDVIGGVTWQKDGSGFFYFPAGKEWRANELKFHSLSTSMQNDVTLYREEDECYSLNLKQSQTREYMFLYSRSADNDEVRFVEYGAKDFRLLLSRNLNLVVDIEHDEESFHIIVNDSGANNRLISVSVDDAGASLDGITADMLLSAKERVAHSNDTFLSELFMFHKRYVLVFIEKGLSRIRLYDKDFNFLHDVAFDEPSYCADVIFTHYESDCVRYEYSSLRCPAKVIEKNLISYESSVIKERFAPVDFNSQLFAVERVYASSVDGVLIPISVISATQCTEPAPVLLYGYGSYEISIEPFFRSSIIPLIKRGFRFAIAHIRGGGDMGRHWYESAKMLTKKKTFEDFVACSEHLIAKGYADEKRLCIMGGSAGGMLMGACMNMKPELYRAVIADVPFVDVLNTMLDSNLPLTPGEYKEWGNPEESAEYFDYIASYCPYQNVARRQYPNLLVTTGLNDPRVGYWEAAKWVAKLRYAQSNIAANDSQAAEHSVLDRNAESAGEIILRVNMEAGHGGNSGREKEMMEISEHYAFLVHFCR